MKYLYSTILLFLVVTPLSAAGVIKIDDTFTLANISGSLDYIEDPSTVLTLDDITKSDKWKRLNKSGINFGYGASAYWFRFSFCSSISMGKDILFEISYPHLDNIDYFLTDGKGYSVLFTGDHKPFNTREVLDRNFVFKIKSRPEKQTVYLRISSSGPVKFQAFLWSYEDFLKRLNVTLPVFWGYYGMLFIMFLYNLILFLSIREKAYCYNTLFVLSLSLLQLQLNGLAFQYLWPSHPWWENHCAFFFISLVIIFIAKYISSFISEENRNKRYFKFVYKSIVLQGWIFLVISVIPGFPVIFKSFLTIWVLYCIVMMYILIGRETYRGNVPVKYLLYGFNLFFLGIIVYALKDFALLPSNIFTEWSMQAGSGLMVVLFSLGLAGKMKAIKDSLAERETRLRDILENTNEGFWEIDNEGITVSVNPEMCRMLRARENEIIGVSIYAFLDDKNTAIFNKQKSLRDSGEADLYDLAYRRLDGTLINCIVNATPRFDKTGEKIGAYALITDISQRIETEKKIKKQNEKVNAMNRELQAANEELEATNEEFEAMNEELIAAQEELTASEERYRTLFETASEGIVLVMEGKITLFNPKILEMTGFRNDEIQDRNFIELVYEEDKAFVIENYKKRMENSEFVPSYECRIIIKDNSVIWVNINLTPVTLDDRMASLAFISDITSRKRTEEIMIQTEKMMTVGGLAAGMAHEINNPLGIIMQGIQNTLRRFSPGMSKNDQVARMYNVDLNDVKGYMDERGISTYLNGIQEAGSRAAEIVTNMLNFGRPSGLQRSMQNINNLVDLTIELASHDYNLKKNYDFKQIKIIRDYDEKLEEVFCIKTEIEQVFLNLLKNGAEAMGEVEREDYSPEFYIKTFIEKGLAVIEISDNGPGMSPDICKRIFDPFFTTKKEGVGTGLGLSVSYFIVTTNHNGQISVDSSEGEWTRFTIRLPFE